MSDFSESLGARIRQARTSAGVSQTDLASALGSIDRSSVANYEAGRQTVTAEKLMAIADAVGCDPRWLLTGWQPAAPVMTAWVPRRAVADTTNKIRKLLQELENG